VTLTSHPHLVPRSRMIRSYTSSRTSASMACSGTALAFLAFVVSHIIQSPHMYFFRSSDCLADVKFILTFMNINYMIKNSRI
jgi:hypothetical protein